MSKATKNFFSFVKGLNTEVSPLNFPDQTALDMGNYELARSGKISRRKGLNKEVGGTESITLPQAIEATDAYSKFIWHGPGGDPSLVLDVIQHGSVLYFYLDNTVLSTNQQAFVFDLSAYKTDDLISTEPCTFAEGRTKLFVANRYMDTVFLDYDPTLNAGAGGVTETVVHPLFRDFEDIEDDVPVDHAPTIAEMPTITDIHFWNLKIRGWKTPDITQYKNDTGTWPAKNMVWHQGYKRVSPVLGETLSSSGVASDDWFKEWDSSKLERELFSNSSGPKGSLFLNPYDTTSLTGGSAANTIINISTWSAPNYTAPVWYLTIQTSDPHLRVPGDLIDIVENGFRWSNGGGTSTHSGSINVVGAECQPGTAGNTIFISIPNPVPTWGFWAGAGQYAALGYVNTRSIVNPNPYITSERASACAYWAGRLFLSGMNHPSLSDLVLFSQVAVAPDRYSKMYQDRDPTSPSLSALLPDDGGVIQLPGMARCVALIPLDNSLLAFATNGVWEISGGRNYFGADGYAVRKITSVEALSSLGISKTDLGVLFTSPRGVYDIVPDEQTGNLGATSLTEESIQTLWNDIEDVALPYIQLIYDDSMKRIKLLYSSEFIENSPFAYDAELLYDLRLQAWYPFTYPVDSEDGYITGFMPTESSDESNLNRKTKYFVVSPTSDQLRICDFYKPVQVPNRFQDFDGTEQEPFMVTGYDNIGDFSTKRQSPFIYTYVERTENISDGSYVGDDGEAADEPINEGSTFIQARWDWADNSAAGKWGTKQQMYRPKKFFLEPATLDGTPVIVAKIKIRGSGRSLHLKFTGVTGFDSVIDGWSTTYRISRENTNDGGTRDR